MHECYEGNRHAVNMKSFMECIASDEEVVAQLDRSEVSHSMNEDDETETVIIKVPTKWEICECCSGDGTHALHGIVIDPSEWDYEEMDDYMSGRYDTACGECNSTGKLKVVDWDSVSSVLKAEWEKWEQARYECDRESYMERMMGA